MLIPPSSRALALHVLIILLEPSGKILKVQNERREFSDIRKLGSKIFKLSFNSNLKTSCHLPPYYSLELNLISSTSHSSRQGSTSHCSRSRPAPRQSRFTRFAASAEENFILRAAGSSFHAFLVRFSCFSEILQIC